MPLLIWLCAIYAVGFGLVHLAFWRMFGWPARLQSSGRVNAAITQTLNIMIAYVFFAYALGLSLISESGRPGLLLAGAGFWALRAVLQPVLFGLEHPTSKGIFALFIVGSGARRRWRDLTP